MQPSLVNLFGIAVIACAVPFALGFVPRLRIPAVVLEIVAGILVGPACLGVPHVDASVQLVSGLGRRVRRHPAPRHFLRASDAHLLPGDAFGARERIVAGARCCDFHGGASFAREGNELGGRAARDAATRPHLCTAADAIRRALLLGGAVIAAGFRFEAILGTFIIGIIFGRVLRGTAEEELNRSRLDAIGYGVFVPVFFVASGMELSLNGLTEPIVLIKIGLFLLLLLAARGLPVLFYRHALGLRHSIAAGFMQATNVSFVVVAVAAGLESNRIIPTSGTALIVAGLLSGLLFPALAQTLLARHRL